MDTIAKIVGLFAEHFEIPKSAVAVRTISKTEKSAEYAVGIESIHGSEFKWAEIYTEEIHWYQSRTYFKTYDFSGVEREALSFLSANGALSKGVVKNHLFGKLWGNYLSMKKRLKEAEKRISDLENKVVELEYVPGGEKFLEAKKHFEGLI